MPIFVLDAFLAFMSKYDILTQGDAIDELFCIVELNPLKGMPLLPIQTKEQKQSQKVLWQLPDVQHYSHTAQVAMMSNTISTIKLIVKTALAVLTFFSAALISSGQISSLTTNLRLFLTAMVATKLMTTIKNSIPISIFIVCFFKSILNTDNRCIPYHPQ